MISSSWSTRERRIRGSHCQRLGICASFLIRLQGCGSPQHTVLLSACPRHGWKRLGLEATESITSTCWRWTSRPSCKSTACSGWIFSAASASHWSLIAQRSCSDPLTSCEEHPGRTAGLTMALCLTDDGKGTPSSASPTASRRSKERAVALLLWNGKALQVFSRLVKPLRARFTLNVAHEKHDARGWLRREASATARTPGHPHTTIGPQMFADQRGATE